MTAAEPSDEIVPTWFGVYRVRGGRVLAAYPFPHDPVELDSRRRARRAGQLVPEERRLLAESEGRPLVSRDRRFSAHGVRPASPGEPVDIPPPAGWAPSELRAALLESAGDELRESWDPSIHVEEAVRALADLDRALNLIAERLGSWAGRDALGREGAAVENPTPLAQAIDGGRWEGSSALPGPDPALAEARRALAHLYLEMRAARATLEKSVEHALPQRAANLSGLLGPELAARMISQARGLDRLARLPASTVQVLGAERAFFEHLRGRAPPPRHGLLFQHPTIQSAPRRQRGKLARALAGKAAIAARLDLAGAPLDPGLRAQYDRRATEIRSQTPRATGRPRRRSRPPLDRTTEDG